MRNFYKKTITKVLIIVSFLLFISGFSIKPVIEVSVNIIGNENIEKITKSVFLSELLDTNKFTVTLVDNIKQLFFEMNLQDLLSTENVILSKREYSKGTLNVILYLRNLNVRKETVEYVRNDVSGDYIYADGKYIRVIQGAWFKFDGKNYIQDENGIYVKGTDGKYYSALAFYSRVPHENTYYVLDCSISYTLNVESTDVKKGTFDTHLSVPLVEHRYDPYNNKLLRIEYPSSDILDRFAKSISFELASRLMDLRKLYGFVENVRMPRVLIDIGSIDGVKPGLCFGVYDGNNYIAELTVARTGGDYSECEIKYIKKGAKIERGFSVVEKKPDFVIPLGISVLYMYHPENLGDICAEFSVKTLDIHREELSSVAFGLSYDLSSSVTDTFHVSYLHRMFSSPVYFIATLKIPKDSASHITLIPMIGLNVRFGIFTLRALTTIDLSNFEIGGGISW
ncbi:hypothetical protein SAMN04488510_12910 [Fervidobacterium changbaicum]|uniref:Uncharacterized protein n=1 Tax=Fervidobacterium changbaicum TaxID=310769 RepID=A0ABX5QTT7_9BACT|nr:hypothetical protein [Fervidobacterium changbaicum]QAV33899.1 hypothetical protein CBS1_09420 [Fervidobacterium changbaicum]SDH73144.1 hypothetical protein SAMN04488510_12910 [Fervidobacterium changbaicum]